MLQCARAHCAGFLLRRFVDAVANADAALTPVLTKLCTLYALHTLQERVGTFALQYGVLSPAQFELVRQEVRAAPPLARPG
jgi:hypothetical protein